MLLSVFLVLLVSFVCQTNCWWLCSYKQTTIWRRILNPTQQSIAILFYLQYNNEAWDSVCVCVCSYYSYYLSNNLPAPRFHTLLWVRTHATSQQTKVSKYYYLLWCKLLPNEWTIRPSSTLKDSLASRPSYSAINGQKKDRQTDLCVCDWSCLQIVNPTIHFFFFFSVVLVVSCVQVSFSCTSKCYALTQPFFFFFTTAS